MTTHRTMIPPIKCQGIKSKLVPWIKAIIPKDFSGRWVEPFMGSGVVAFNAQPSEAILADANPHLIRFYTAVQNKEITAAIARRFLQEEGALLERLGDAHFYEVRFRFNESHSPLDFLFLSRACFNGMIRFNRKGQFNVPFCRKPNRFAPAYITKICNQIQVIADVCAFGNYQFVCQDFRDSVALAEASDVIYCDPPYIGRHVDYFNGWDEEDERALKTLLDGSQARFILSTWHSNDYRENMFLKTIWSEYGCLTREHFYHVGAKEKNRNPMMEALITNFEASYSETVLEKHEQLRLFE